MKKNLTLLFVLFAMVCGAFAENEELNGVYPYESEKYGWSNENATLEMSHWSLYMPIGLTVFDGDQGSGAKYGKDNTPYSMAIGLGVTYDFTPLWSVSLEFNTSSYGKNMWKGSMKVEDGDRSIGYMHDFCLYGSFDLMDACFPRRKNTIFSLYPQFGGGMGLYQLQFMNEDGDIVYADKTGNATNTENDDYVATMYYHMGVLGEFNITRSFGLGIRLTYKYYTTDYVDGHASAFGAGNRNNDGVVGLDLLARVKFNAQKKSHCRNMPMGLENELLTKKVLAGVQQREVEKDTIVIINKDTIYSFEKQEVKEVAENEDMWFVYFDNDKYSFTPKALIEVQQMASRLTKLYPDKCLEIVGSCDDTGSDSYNVTLAKNRAKAVREQLINLYKIDADRLVDMGVGKIKNVNSSFAPNRRVVMRLITKEEADELRKQKAAEEK